MTVGESYRVVETEAEAAQHGGPAIVVPTLRLENRVQPLVAEYERISSEAELFSVLRPIYSWKKLGASRRSYSAVEQRYKETVAYCHGTMQNPVGGGPSMENAWFQGFATSLGTSALLQLQSARQGAGETLDRKAAYALAVFSLYIAVASMALTVLFGWLSLK
jgi:hypothetical protein